MKFHVGEIAIIHAPGNPHHGLECEILATPKGREWRDHKGGWVEGHRYLVHIPGVNGPRGHDVWTAEERTLRKRRPPIPDEVLRIFEREPANA